MDTTLIVVGAVIACAITILTVVAPKTKTDKDDKALGLLSRLAALLGLKK